MTYKIKIAVENAEFIAYHGYYEAERLTGHTFIVSAHVWSIFQDSTTENIENTVNYEQIYNIIKIEMSHPRELIETVAVNILKQIKSLAPHIAEAAVKIEKLSPQLGGKVAKSVIEMQL